MSSYNDFTIYHQSAGEKVTSGNRSATSRPSIVDRALYGEPVPTWLQPKEKSNWHGPNNNNRHGMNTFTEMRSSIQGVSAQDQLVELYDADLIGKLDDRMQANYQASEPKWKEM